MKNKNVVVMALFVMGLGMTACGEKPAKEQSPVENKNRVTMASGLAYEVITAPAADAKSPVKGTEIEVHYTGWLNDNGKPGTKFDSSEDRGRSFKFEIGIGRVIKGWDEGVMAMKVGEKRRLFIPAALGYGSYGAGAVIPPNADLIFDVTLIAVKEQKVEEYKPIGDRVKLESGLSYDVLKKPEAEAKSPKEGNQIEVHYTGWLNVDGKPGKKFDSSEDRGFPFKFSIGVGQVIEGWDEGVISMKVGEKRRLFIPANLGYGSRGAGAAIPPNSDLIFDVTLLAIK